MDTYAAIADPTRRRLLAALRSGPRSVTALAEEVGYHQPGTSRHLRILRDAGLVQDQPQGRQRIYSLCLEPFLELDAWVQAHIEAFTGRLDRLDDALERR